MRIVTRYKEYTGDREGLPYESQLFFANYNYFFG